MDIRRSLIASLTLSVLGCGGVTEEMPSDTIHFDRLTPPANVVERGNGVLDAVKIIEKAPLADNEGAPGVRAEVPVIKAVTAPFRPDINKCTLPAKIKKKIKQQANWLPPGLVAQANRIPVKNVTHVGQESVNILLHTVSFQPAAKPNTSATPILVSGANTYTSLDIAPFIDPGHDNFLYTLDCSGYLNAAVSLAGGVSGAAMKSAASTALSSSSSAFAARATIFSPLLVALFPDKVPPSVVSALSARDRTELLFALNAQLPDGATAADVLKTPFQVDILWTSVSGSSSFQGEASLSGQAGGSVGVFTAGGSTSGGGKISKESKFSNFDTYLINVSPFNESSMTVAVLRTAIQKLVNGAALVSPVRRVNAQYEFALDLPLRVCEGTTWTVDKNGTDAVSGTAAARFDPSKASCGFVVAAQPEDVLKKSGFKLVGTNGSLSFGVLLSVPQ